MYYRCSKAIGSTLSNLWVCRMCPILRNDNQFGRGEKRKLSMAACWRSTLTSFVTIRRKLAGMQRLATSLEGSGQSFCNPNFSMLQIAMQAPQTYANVVRSARCGIVSRRHYHSDSRESIHHCVEQSCSTVDGRRQQQSFGLPIAAYLIIVSEQTPQQVTHVICALPHV